MAQKIINVLCLLLACAMCAGCSTKMKRPEQFASPEAALQALRDAVAARSVERADQIFGSEGDYILHTGDPELDKQRGERFVRLFNERHVLKAEENGDYTLILGSKGWPFPVPLTTSGDRWYFDAESGREEIINRVIGENELNSIRVARTIYLAQRNYASQDRDGDGVREYADRLLSTPGQQDGLYWPATEDGEQSPLGPAVAKAADESYTVNLDGEPKPFRGYYYKMYAEPPNDSKTADILERPGKYWLVAYPAAWGASGVMTFASNERGRIYQKNLGETNTVAEPPAVDDSWTRIE